MAEKTIDIDNSPRFGFRKVKIHNERLGEGSYGVVRKATCDDTLPCAAKLFHSVFFKSNDPGISVMKKKFEEECKLMGRIRHPCIVQYLQTVQDPESDRPILLMELMDETLTKFLKRSSGPLAFQLQVNLSYDIALALAYLHSNGVVHRDLSSNCLLYTSPSPRDATLSRMPSSA